MSAHERKRVAVDPNNVPGEEDTVEQCHVIPTDDEQDIQQSFLCCAALAAREDVVDRSESSLEAFRQCSALINRIASSFVAWEVATLNHRLITSHVERVQVQENQGENEIAQVFKRPRLCPESGADETVKTLLGNEDSVSIRTDDDDDDGANSFSQENLSTWYQAERMKRMSELLCKLQTMQQMLYSEIQDCHDDEADGESQELMLDE